ncbi:MAG: leucine-rich repeat domain-containing protein, partial [Clostridia bacterium]|nr:leucine-rich repeat domain-containing protein [Clostridia bacterium]
DLVVYCSVCGAELSRGHHEIDALEHKYGEWMETKAPTCIENGEETRYCENDNAHIETREINALGHTSGAAVEENRVEPSYDDTGSYDLVVYCSVCGEELSREHHEIDALVHTPAAAIEENRIEPKCEENGGYDLVVYCSECGAELSREHKEISAIGHKYGEWIETKAPTCIENGEETRYCENDNVHKETRKINALGHTPKAAIEENRIEPKCEESGGYDLVVYCSVCGEELSREHNEIAALEHSYTAVVTEPTCTEQGYTTHTCDKCNYSYTDNYVAALGHSYKDGYIFDDDYHWQETTCGHSDAIIKVAHNFGDNNICSACGYNALKYVKIEGKEEYAVCELTNGDVKNIYIPDTYEDLPVTKINDKVFYCNTTIEKVIMSDNITYVGESAFYNCINLNTIVLSESLQIIKNSTFASCSSLTSITIPDSVIIIGNYAFYECNNLTDVVIGKKLRDIGSMAFYLCTELTSITIPDSVNSRGHGACYACDKLITVNIGNGVTEIEGETFYGCGRLREVIFGENSQLTKIGYSAFKNCYDLTAITIPEKVTEIEDGYLFFDLPAFANCGRLVEVYNKSSLEIEAGSTAYGYVGYYARAILTDISESKISKDENGFVMYNGDTDTVFIRYDGEETDLVLPQCNIIQSYAFVYGNITTVILPEDIEEIGEFSFNGCANLKSINIPNKVRRMGTRAFSGCQSLSSTIILDKIESIGEWAFYGC